MDSGMRYFERRYFDKVHEVLGDSCYRMQMLSPNAISSFGNRGLINSASIVGIAEYNFLLIPVVKMEAAEDNGNFIYNNAIYGLRPSYNSGCFAVGKRLWDNFGGSKYSSVLAPLMYSELAHIIDPVYFSRGEKRRKDQFAVDNVGFDTFYNAVYEQKMLVNCRDKFVAKNETADRVRHLVWKDHNNGMQHLETIAVYMDEAVYFYPDEEEEYEGRMEDNLKMDNEDG